MMKNKLKLKKLVALCTIITVICTTFIFWPLNVSATDLYDTQQKLTADNAIKFTVELTYSALNGREYPLKFGYKYVAMQGYNPTITKVTVNMCRSGSYYVNSTGSRKVMVPDPVSYPMEPWQFNNLRADFQGFYQFNYPDDYRYMDVSSGAQGTYYVGGVEITYTLNGVSKTEELHFFHGEMLAYPFPIGR